MFAHRSHAVYGRNPKRCRQICVAATASRRFAEFKSEFCTKRLDAAEKLGHWTFALHRRAVQRPGHLQRSRRVYRVHVVQRVRDAVTFVRRCDSDIDDSVRFGRNRVSRRSAVYEADIDGRAAVPILKRLYVKDLMRDLLDG